MYSDKELSLIPFTEKDSHDETYRSWFNDVKVTKYNSHGLFPLTDEKFEAFVKGLHKEHIVFKIVITKQLDSTTDGTGSKGMAKKIWIGNCSLQSFNWINRSAEFAIVIGDTNFWNKGYAKRALKLLLYHGFNKLNLHRIWTGTTANNIGMQMAAKGLGMRFEGQSIDGVFLDGRYVDVFHYGILKEAFCEKIIYG
jgi:RimJ/RimL family protein N-acetyltransferase